MGVLNLAHELLHSFGARHDPRSCTPRPEEVRREGRYLMSKYSSSGVQANNDVISNCTAEAVAATLEDSVSINIIGEVCNVQPSPRACLAAWCGGPRRGTAGTAWWARARSATAAAWRRVWRGGRCVSRPGRGAGSGSAACGSWSGGGQ